MSDSDRGGEIARETNDPDWNNLEVLIGGLRGWAGVSSVAGLHDMLAAAARQIEALFPPAPTDWRDEAFRAGAEAAARVADASRASADAIYERLKDSADAEQLDRIAARSRAATDIATQIRSLPTPPSVSPWRDMKTSPRDGTAVALWDERGWPAAGQWFMYPGATEPSWRSHDGDLIIPRCWMPLPVPPPPAGEG